MNDFQKLQHKTAIEQTSKKCVMCSGILAQKKAKVADYYEAMLDHSITSVTIVEVLKSWGVAASATTVRNHRRGNDGYAEHMTKIKEAAGL